jgi:hypothetical protein
MARDFRKITAWQRAHALTLRTDRATSGFPRGLLRRDERFGLVSQIRRACTSIPTNVAKDLGYLPKDQHTNLSTEVIEIRRMLLAFNKTLQTSSKLEAQNS